MFKFAPVQVSTSKVILHQIIARSKRKSCQEKADVKAKKYQGQKYNNIATDLVVQWHKCETHIRGVEIDSLSPYSHTQTTTISIEAQCQRATQCFTIPYRLDTDTMQKYPNSTVCHSLAPNHPAKVSIYASFLPRLTHCYCMERT